MAKVAFVLADEFEDSEFQVPYDRIKDVGHQVTVIGIEAGRTVKGKKGEASVTIDATPDQVQPDEFDAVVVPGGYSPDRLRMHAGVVKFVDALAHDDKPVAAICHAGSLLIEAGVVAGRTLTSWPSIRTDLINAGATWVDQEVVVDGNLITSRHPGDLDAFVEAILRWL